MEGWQVQTHKRKPVTISNQSILQKWKFKNCSGDEYCWDRGTICEFIWGELAAVVSLVQDCRQVETLLSKKKKQQRRQTHMSLCAAARKVSPSADTTRGTRTARSQLFLWYDIFSGNASAADWGVSSDRTGMSKPRPYLALQDAACLLRCAHLRAQLPGGGWHRTILLALPVPLRWALCSHDERWHDWTFTSSRKRKKKNNCGDSDDSSSSSSSPPKHDLDWISGRQYPSQRPNYWALQCGSAPGWPGSGSDGGGVRTSKLF